MANISVDTLERENAYEVHVTVREGRERTRHTVTLAKADYERISRGAASPADLVVESFRFLLEREPKESILRSFDLTVITRYFPEYEREIKKRL
ncbi:MAG: hypothetical protein PVH50_07125 [Anaerolineae bacterium]